MATIFDMLGSGASAAGGAISGGGVTSGGSGLAPPKKVGPLEWLAAVNPIAVSGVNSYYIAKAGVRDAKTIGRDDVRNGPDATPYYGATLGPDTGKLLLFGGLGLAGVLLFTGKKGRR